MFESKKYHNLRSICSLILLFITTLSFAQNDNNNFPNDFLGVYKGTLSIYNPSNEVQQIPMEFHLLETDSAHRFEFKLIYDGQARNYFLLEIDSEKGLYDIDEDNGIILKTRLQNNTLFSFFEVNGSMLSSRYAFSGDQIDFEILFTTLKAKEKTGEETGNEIFAYPISVVQKAILKKE